MSRYLAILLLALPAWATTSIVSVTPSATQAIITYATDQTASTCTVRASEGGSLGTMVNDVNTSLFSGSNAATRAGSVAGSTFVLGTRGDFVASDGKAYARALAVRTAHIVGITCGSDAEVTVGFTTANIPFASPPESFQFDSTQFGNLGQPTISTSQSSSYIDALTGLKLTRLTDDADGADASGTNNTPNAPLDPTSAWATPENLTGTSAFASYGGTGTTTAYLFLPVNPATDTAFEGYDARNILTDIRFNINGFGNDATPGNRVISGCLSTDHGQTCASNTIDFPTFPQNIGSQAIESFPSTGYPAVLFSQWVTNPTQTLSQPNTTVLSGTLTVTSNVNVAWASGGTFLALKTGDWIHITGSGCPNSELCVISSVLDAKHLVLSSSSSNVIRAAFSAVNFGLKLWKKTGTGTISLNTARYDYVYNTQMSISTEGAVSACSKNYADTTVDRFGSPLGRTQHGFLCMFLDIYSNGRLYWVGTNGEGRFLSRLTAPAVVGSPLGKDDNPFLYGACSLTSGITPESPFDATDPNVLYCNGITASGAYSVIRKLVYKSGTAGCGYKAYVPDYNITHDNSCMTVTNVTKASLNQDLASQMAAVVPTFNSTYFNSWAMNGPGGIGQMSLIAKAGGQNTISWYARMDMSSLTIVQAANSWNSYPMKWGAVHGGCDQTTNIYGRCYVAPLTSPSQTGIGQFQLNLTAIQGLGDTSLTNSYVDASTCEALGVTDATFIAQGATGLNCIQTTISNLDAYNPTPSATDLATFPHPKNSTACGGDNSTANCYSQIATIQEGDYVIDASTNGLGEQFRLVKKLSAISYVWQRGVRWDCGNGGKTAHPNGWTPIMWVGRVCASAVFYWIKNDGTITADDPAMNAGHHDILIPNSFGTATYSQAGYDTRIGTIAAQIGQPATFSSGLQYGPRYNGSTAALDPSQIQSHASCRQVIAGTNELKWCLDGRPFGGAGGGTTRVGYQVVASCVTSNTCTTSNAAVANVYKVGNMTSSPGGTGSNFSTLDRKKLPVHAWAGKYLLTDISGVGSSISAAANYTYCVADFAGECIGGSSAGDVFEKVPQADTGGECDAQLDVNTLCWISAPIAPSVTQYGIDRQDTNGSYWRKLSTFFQGLGWVNNFWNARPTPDASLVWSVSRWTNGISSNLYAGILPPWPTGSDTTADAYVLYPVTLGSNANAKARIAFGYAENGASTSYYCTTRREKCVTDGGASPFMWASESQTLVTCSSGCTINVPIMMGRVAYMVVERLDSVGNVITTQALPPVTIPFVDAAGGGSPVFSGNVVRSGNVK